MEENTVTRLKKDTGTMIRIDLPALIHDILITENYEYRGDKVVLDLRVAELKKVFNSEIENTLKFLEQINTFSEEEQQILKDAGCY